MMVSPKYSYPLRSFRALVRDILLLRRRDFHQDAQACIANLDPPLKILGSDNIPRQGPCVLTVNHYHREGFGAEWLAFSVSALVPRPIHWIMTSEFMYQGKWYEGIGAKGSRILLKRIAQVYGFTTMPPMPPRPADVEERARSVRAVLEYVKHADDPILGLAPEGYDTPEGILTRPAPGLGRFALLLSRAGLKFVPVGVHEADRTLHVHFGKSYALNVPPHLTSVEKDAHISKIIMENIARLLPVHLRGEFS